MSLVMIKRVTRMMSSTPVRETREKIRMRRQLMDLSANVMMLMMTSRMMMIRMMTTMIRMRKTTSKVSYAGMLQWRRQRREDGWNGVREKVARGR